MSVCMTPVQVLLSTVPKPLYQKSTTRREMRRSARAAPRRRDASNKRAQSRTKALPGRRVTWQWSSVSFLMHHPRDQCASSTPVPPAPERRVLGWRLSHIWSARARPHPGEHTSSLRLSEARHRSFVFALHRRSGARRRFGRRAGPANESGCARAMLKPAFDTDSGTPTRQRPHPSIPTCPTRPFKNHTGPSLR